MKSDDEDGELLRFLTENEEDEVELVLKGGRDMDIKQTF